MTHILFSLTPKQPIDNIEPFVNVKHKNSVTIYCGILLVNAHRPVNAHIIFVCWRSRTNTIIEVIYQNIKLLKEPYQA